MDKRKVEEYIFKVLMLGAVLIVIGSLVFILATILVKGLPTLSWEMITKTPQGGYYMGKGGGILNALLGSLLLGIGATILAAAVALPIVFYLNLYLRRRSRFALAVRFFLDVLWGIPSVVYGAFGFTLMIFFGLQASLLAGMITVALLVLPIMARGMDEVLKMVTFELQEASLALGATRLETAGKVIFRQAFPGILTAVLMAFGRGMSDAAAVLFTAGFTDSLPYSLFKPVATLPLAVFFQLGTPFPEVQSRGYAAALILTAIVFSLSILARLITRGMNKHVIK
ncbi:MAG TPA: phosphate ABC transporter permease [Candidatus Omnitrophica bacterium]|nr:phosphate ABC transporter permease [Candidatus Omnitrophota bacterium]HCI44032.1 phosphate ABC transporter permease [Candidatus Omnitrophota bacterium]